MKLTTTAAPHLRTSDSTRKVMTDVLIALLPAAAVSVWVFGIRALIMMVICTIASEGFEYITMKFLRNRKDWKPDLSASVTGLLFAMNLSPAVEIWQMIVGAAFAIILGKAVFGGLGQNIFNPALIGRVFMLTSFPVIMTTWYAPFYYNKDIITSASVLGILKQNGYAAAMNSYSYWDMFIGTVPGSIGETSALALLIGFAYLVFRGRIKITIPVAYIGTVLIISTIFWMIDPAKYGDPLLHILAGGLMLGALFMATDMVTSPMTSKGQFLFGIGCGIITLVIRYWGGYPEGVSYSILIMNAVVPLIDMWAKPKRFGVVKKQKSGDTK